MARPEDPSHTTRQAVAPALVSARFAVEVVEGPDAGKRFEIDGDTPARALVGQSPACSLELTDRLVSRRHIALQVEGGELRVADLRSTNGTYVNGAHVTDVFVVGGEEIRIGETKLLVRALGTRPRAIPQKVPRHFGRMLGASPAVVRIHPILEKLAASDVPVIIEGETGTGKEVLAEALHEESARARAPFVVFDCTAVAPNLLESTLFGHERGAFTGATAQRKGVFEQAHGGTLFIDEIGDFDFSLQPKLLRAIQGSEICRVGSDRWIKTNVRILTATRRDLDREVQMGRFRDDLFFRLSVARVELPPLRERTGDVALLARHFWDALGGKDRPIPFDLFRAWEDYNWPGNIRELRNAVARRIALGDLAGPAVAAPEEPAAPAPAGGDEIDAILERRLPFPIARDVLLAEFERRYVERVLVLHGGKVAEAAAASGIARRYFNVLRARHKV